ncbi:uncharacterized protein PV09_07950 [Verruconis gallopava]|uniref:glucan 1,4-alpha-glucosidase n=1 Tax=Verruconis gallopava TaxID=253628 RepID=A0A0D2A268_9PEZI|nr:uncharacterized protein PV09_07950 [Verruconis gallopava]KIW00420.1 hypothetical protein PV09_07950 [Verruconis gallopava]
MIPLVPFVVFAYLALYALAFSIPAHLLPSQKPLGKQPSWLSKEKTEFGPQSSLDAWLEEEQKIALENLLNNIAPGGARAPDAAPGTVIASPSKEHPNYYYQWIRDAAITLATLVDWYEEDPTSYLSSKIVSIMEAYAAFSHRLQHTPNPSGTFEDHLSGLGEPKFHVDGSAFTENWGRPQRDGPPLRAITLMRYMKAYNASHADLWTQRSGFFQDLYDARMPANSTIKADLEYTSHYWRAEGFDLWEELIGLHFFTAMVQLRALREGARVASLFADPGAARWYVDQAERMQSDLLPRFWSEEKGHLVETLDSGRSGLDCGILLGAIHGTTTECSTNPTEAEQCVYAPYSDEILVTLLNFVRDQAARHPINTQPIIASPYKDISDLAGVGVGRYPEDGYDGYETIPGTGNPWFLCTSSVSEVLYRTRLHLQTTGVLNVTERGLPFWEALIPTQHPSPGTYKRGNDVFEEAVRRLKSVGDAFLKVVRTHVDGEGRMSEQLDRHNGYMRGATDLTWSYGAFLQATRARKMAA